MKEVEKIKKGIKELKELDKDYKLFGADSHKYKSNKRLEEDEILKYEDRYNIKLPEGYRMFLREIGNGGVGPYYGINKLEDSIPDYHQRDINFLKDSYEFEESWNWSSKIFRIFELLRGMGFGNLNEYYQRKYMNTLEHEVDKEEWEAINFFRGEIDNDVSEFFDRLYWKSYFSREIGKGSLEICEYGCALRYRLIVSGRDRGTIWFDERADQNGLSPIINKKGEKLDFFTWYLSWIDESIDELKSKTA